jgi:hypothetical protein
MKHTGTSLKERQIPKVFLMKSFKEKLVESLNQVEEAKEQVFIHIQEAYVA